MTNRVPGGGVLGCWTPTPATAPAGPSALAMRQKSDLKLLGAALGIDAKPLQQCLGIWRDLSQGRAEHLAPLAEGCRRHPLERRHVASGLRGLLGHELNE